ncbi:hypothetical protein THRCLA_22893, partial [Thraustotheca clavata]
MSTSYSQCVANQPNKNEVDFYGQCGGIYYTGSTKCKSGSSCVVINPWFSQCK